MIIHETALAVARTHWRLPATEAVRLGGGATANLVFAFTDRAGRRSQVGRCHASETCPSRVERVTQVLSSWTRTVPRLPLAAPLPTIGGRYSAAHRGQVWTMSPYIRGRHATGTATDVTNTASALASLHQISPLLPPGWIAAQTHWGRWWLDPGSCWQACADEVNGVTRALLDGYRPFVELVAAQQPSGPLPLAWSHGDVHPGNLLFSASGRLLALLDWDALDIRPRVWDLASAVAMLARTGPGDYRLRPDAVRLLLGTYEAAACPLSPAERAALWPCLLATQLPDPAHLASLRRAGHPLDEALARPLSALATLSGQRRALHREPSP